MSHLICPLCGLSIPLRTFWNGIDEDVEDIEAVYFRGLGRGRGFEKTESFSVLDDEEICNAIVRRCYVILDLLGEGSEEEDYSGLLERVNNVLPAEISWIDDLESAVEALIREYGETQEKEEDDVVNILDYEEG
jgi:hypothetical protein